MFKVGAEAFNPNQPTVTRYAAQCLVRGIVKMKKLLLLLCMGLIAPLGVTGCAIDDGAAGEPGAAGEDGSDGSDGDDGSDGSDGDDGSDGADGTDGAGEVILEPGDCAVDLSATNPRDLFVCCSAGGTAQSFEGEDTVAEEDSLLVFDVECHDDSDGRCRGASTCGDGVADGDDNCPDQYNPSQDDLDGDGVGDACDGDVDGDGIADDVDQCVEEPGAAISWACDEDSGFEGMICETDANQLMCYSEEEDCENNDCADSSGLLYQWTDVDCDRHGCNDTDTDGDGIRDVDDECPADAEDQDQSDGCPDSDGDGLLGEDDECPGLSEDFDGIQDGDGCPEQDADDDGVQDHVDLCPLVEEDHDHFEDDDGCPEDGSGPV